MAKNGFRMIDAEMHVMEPTDLWQRYIDAEFQDRAPRRLDERRWDIRTLVEGEVRQAYTGARFQHQAHVRSAPHPARINCAPRASRRNRHSAYRLTNPGA